MRVAEKRPNMNLKGRNLKLQRQPVKALTSCLSGLCNLRAFREPVPETVLASSNKDSQCYLLNVISKGVSWKCLYEGNLNLVEIFKASFRAEVRWRSLLWTPLPGRVPDWDGEPSVCRNLHSQLCESSKIKRRAVSQLQKRWEPLTWNEPRDALSRRRNLEKPPFCLRKILTEAEDVRACMRA